MPAKKRKLDHEETSSPLTADQLYDKAIDFAEKAERLYSKRSNHLKAHHKVLKAFKHALQFAEAARDQYSQLGEYEDASITQQLLIEPYSKQVQWFSQFVAAIDLRLTAENYVAEHDFKNAIKEARIAKGRYLAITLPAIEENDSENQDIREELKKLDALIEECKSQKRTIQSSASFFTPPPTNLSNLRSLNGFSSLEELTFLSGTRIEKISAIQSRLLSVKNNLVVSIADITEADRKTQRAHDLYLLSQDFKEKLLSWLSIEPLDAAPCDVVEKAIELLTNAEQTASTSKTIYKLLGCPDKAREVKKYMNDCGSRKRELRPDFLSEITRSAWV